MNVIKKTDICDRYSKETENNSGELLLTMKSNVFIRGSVKQGLL